MQEVQVSLAKDEEVTKHLEEKISELRSNDSEIGKQLAKSALATGAVAAKDSLIMLNLIQSGSGVMDFGKVGSEVVTKIFGDDIGKEVINQLFIL